MNTDIATLEQQVCALLVHYLEPRWAEDPACRIDVSGATNLTSDLTLDSFQVMEFLMEIEDNLNVAIDMNSLSDVHTVSDLTSVVARQLGA
jgi:acyl carrier protein